MGRRSRAKGVYKGKKGKKLSSGPTVTDDPVYDDVDHC